jgi:hypothetical protein
MNSIIRKRLKTEAPIRQKLPIQDTAESFERSITPPALPNPRRFIDHVTTRKCDVWSALKVRFV